MGNMREQLVQRQNARMAQANQAFAAQAREQLDRAAQMTFSGVGSGADISPTPTTTRRWPSLMERATNRERMDEYLRTEPIYTKPPTYMTEQMRKNANAGASNFVGVQNWVNFNPALKPATTTQEAPAYVSSSGWAHRAEEYGRQAEAQKTDDWKAKQAEYDQKLWELEEQARNYSAAGMTDKYLQTQAEIDRVKAEKAAHGDSVGQLEAGQAEAEANAERAKATDWEIMIADQIKRTGKEDLMDDLLELSRLKSQLDVLQSGQTTPDGIPLPANPAIKQTQAEFDVLYGKLRGIYGDVVSTWIAYADRVRNRESAESAQRAIAQAARDNPFWASLATIPANVASGAGILDVAEQKLQRWATGSDIPIDYNTPAMMISQGVNTARGTVGEKIAADTEGWIGSNTGIGNLYSFGYQTLMSMADTGVAALTGNPILLGGAAATSAMTEAKERGASDGQALAIGLISGVLEGVMEKCSINKLLNMTTTGAKDVVWNIVEQAVTEGSEEFKTTLANTVIDQLIMGNKSQLATRKRELMAQGYSAQQSEEMAKAEWRNGLMADALGGTISGGVFAGVGSAGQMVGNKLANRTAVQQTQTAPAVQQPQAAPATVSKNATVPQTVDTDRAAVDQAAQMTFASAEPIAPEAYRQTAEQILDEGIFESPKYGPALQQTGLSRGETRQALRSVSRGVMTASVDPNVQTVLRAIQQADSQPAVTQEVVQDVQEQTEAMPEAPAAQEAPRQPGTVANPATVPQMPVAQPAQPQPAQPQPVQTPPIQPNVESVQPQSEQPGIQGVGAAESGFSGPIGGWKRDADTFIKDTELPKQDKNGGVISDSAGTMFETNVPQETKEQIERFAYNGELSYFPETNERTIQRVHDEIAEKSFSGAYESTLQQLRDGKRNRDLSAAAGVLAIQAANRGLHDMAATMFKEIRAMSTDLAQGLQIMSVYNKLTPMGRYNSWLNDVARLNSEISKKNSLNKISPSQKQQATEVVQNVREEALQELENFANSGNTGGWPDSSLQKAKDKLYAKDRARAQAKAQKTYFPEFKVGDTVIVDKTGAKGEIVRKNADGTYTVNMRASDNGMPIPTNVSARDLAAYNPKTHGVAVEDWIKEIGVGVAKAMENRITPKNTVKPISSIIRGDLVKFASNYVNKAKSTTVKRTAVDILRDFLNNRAEYLEAWNEAKQYLTEKYGQDQPDALEDFMQGTITYNAVGPDKVMFDAIVSSAVEQKLTGKRLQMRDHLGDRSGIIEEIAADLIGKVGAEGADAQMIHDAVARYVNEEVLNQAEKRSPGKQVNSDINAAVKEIGITFSQIIRSGADSKQAVIKQLADFMVQKYGISKQNAHSVAKHITKNFNEMVAEKSKAALERMVAPKTKKEQKTFSQTFRELANMGAFSNPKYAEYFTTKLFGDAIQIDNEMMQKYLAAKTPEQIEAADKEMMEYIGQRVPTNIWKALNKLRYFDLLANVSTHKKNIGSGIGNTFLLKLPKDILSTAGEAITDFVSKKTGHGGIQRTKAVLNPFSKADQARIATAFQDVKNVRDQLMGAGDRKDGKSAIHDYEIAWKLNDPKTKAGEVVSNTLQFLERVLPDGNAKLLDVEDFMICSPNYAASLASYMKANGLMEPNNAARKYAIQEALEVVGRDSNVLSKWVTGLGTHSLIGKVASAVTMPFKKTNANMFARLVLDYNPVSAAINIMREVRDIRNNPDSEKNASTIINRAAQGITGGGLLYLGYLMARQGLLRGIGVGDEEEREMQRDSGELDFSLVYGDEEYYPINQFSPSTTMLLVGAVLWESIASYNRSDRQESPLTFEESLVVVSSLLDPVFETSPFTGVNDVVRTVQKNPDADDGELLVEIGLNMVGNLAKQFIPSIVSKIANAMDPYAREVYIDKNSKVPDTIQRFWQGLTAKDPIGRQNMAMRVDEWGHIQEGGKGDTPWETYSAVTRTGTPSQKNETPAQAEVRRLYQDTGYDASPTERPKYFSVTDEDGESKRVDLTAEQYNQYEIDYGQTYEGLVEEFADNDVYDSMPGDVQYKMLDEYAKTYADQTAKAALDVGFEPYDWVKELEGKSEEEVIDAIILRTLNNASGYGDADLAAAVTMTVDEGLSPEVAEVAEGQAQKYADAVYRYELGYTDVPEWVEKAMQMTTDQQREKYLAGVAAGNYAEDTYGKKYDGLEQMLSDGLITDEVALFACSPTVQTAYRENCKGNGISAEQFIDVYGYAVANGNSAEEQREAGLKYIEKLGLSEQQASDLSQGLYDAIQKYVPVDPNPSKDWLAEHGTDEAIIEQMTDDQRIAYNTYIRTSGLGLTMDDYMDVKNFDDVDGHNTDLVKKYIEANYPESQWKALYLSLGYKTGGLPKHWK